MAAMGLLASNAAVSGSIRFEGGDLLTADTAVLNRVRGSKLTMIFQDPMTSLAPHLKIGTQLAEVLVCHSGMSWRDAWSSAARILARVRVPDAARRLHQYPHELSGGLRQRVTIGMSLLCEPALVIADEPTSALDVTVQAQLIELLRTMREEVGMALVLISHDLAVVAGLAERILVMYAGRIVESADSAELFRDPRHPYTAALLKCIPSLSGPSLARLPTLPGQPPQPGDSLDGCAFAPRCPRAAERCRRERPLLREAVDATDGDSDGIENGGARHGGMPLPVVAVNAGAMNAGVLLSVADLQVEFGARAVLRDVTFDLYAGETLGLVGESGSGKSTLARAILCLIRSSKGSVVWRGRDLLACAPAALRTLRRDLQIVFQDPLASLNPRMTVGETIAEPLRIFEPDLNAASRAEAKVAGMLERGRPVACRHVRPVSPRIQRRPVPADRYCTRHDPTVPSFLICG